jgi:mannose-1-phosphate guanylyltransferase/mannose-1-phosphate guanylyltransferase/phosphomannomutase
MRAMVLAAGLGTRLRPITHAMPKPMVPVLNRPVMEHIARLLARHGFTETIANLHWFPEVIESHFGDGAELGLRLSYRREPQLLGTAGGVRNVAGFLGDSFLVISGDALTDIDLAAMREFHQSHDGVVTVATKRVADTSEFGVVIAGADGRIQGFQEKPDPAEALSDLASCMIYVLDPEIFDYFPPKPVVDFAREVFPALLEHDVPFHVHRIDAYWNDVGSLPEYLRGNLDAVQGEVEVEPAGELQDPSGGDQALEQGDPGVAGRVLMGQGCRIGAEVRLDGPLAIGPGCTVGDGAVVKESVLLPGAEVPPGSLVASAIYGRKGHLT